MKHLTTISTYSIIFIDITQESISNSIDKLSTGTNGSALYRDYKTTIILVPDTRSEDYQPRDRITLIRTLTY